jgi:hypothetical protein
MTQEVRILIPFITGEVCFPTTRIHRELTKAFGDDRTVAQHVGNDAELETVRTDGHDHDRASTSQRDVNAT